MKSLCYDEEALASIEAFFINEGREMTENNRKQALVLEGCDGICEMIMEWHQEW